MKPTLLERAHQLMEESQRRSQEARLRKKAIAGLAIAPLAAASSAMAQSGRFSAPTFDFSFSNHDGFFDSVQDNTTKVILQNGRELKIYGSMGFSYDSGSHFTFDYIFVGAWNVAPAAGDPFQVIYNAMISFGQGGATVSNASWTYKIDLNNDGTPEYSATGSVQNTPNPTLSLVGSGLAMAPVSGATNYRIDLIVTNSGSFNGGITSETVTIPQNSFDLIAVPEPSSSLLLLAGGLVALLRWRWRKLRKARVA